MLILNTFFIIGKIKAMFQTMLEKGKILSEVLDEHSIINKPVDMCEMISRFTTDIIGSTSFGIECNCLKSVDSEFRTFSDEFVHRAPTAIFISMLPGFIRRLVRVRPLPEHLESYFVNIVKSTVEYRERHNFHRKDFMHLLLEIKHKGRVMDTDDKEVVFKQNDAEHLSLVEIASQCLIFFIAGFETSGTTLTFAVLELSLNQDIQDKPRQEIRKILRESNGVLTYDSLMTMNCLDKVVSGKYC